MSNQFFKKLNARIREQQRAGVAPSLVIGEEKQIAEKDMCQYSWTSGSSFVTHRYHRWWNPLTEEWIKVTHQRTSSWSGFGELNRGAWTNYRDVAETPCILFKAYRNKAYEFGVEAVLYKKYGESVKFVEGWINRDLNDRVLLSWNITTEYTIKTEYDLERPWKEFIEELRDPECAIWPLNDAIIRRPVKK